MNDRELLDIRETVALFRAQSGFLTDADISTYQLDLGIAAPKLLAALDRLRAAVKVAINILEEEDIAAQDSPAERAYSHLVQALTG